MTGMRGKVKISDHARRAGLSVPKWMEPGRPMVEWRRQVCGHVLLRAYVSRDGWAIFTEDVPLSRSAWRALTGHSAEDIPNELSPPKPKAKGNAPVLALDPEAWEHAAMYLGCVDAKGWKSTRLLAEHVRECRDTRRPILRRVALP